MIRHDPAGLDHRRAGQRPARPHVRDRRAAHGLSRPHVLARRRHADRPGRRRRGHGVATTTSTRSRAFAPRRRRRHLRVRERPGRDRAGRGRDARRCGPAAHVLHIAQHRAREKTFLARSRLSGRRRSRAVATLDELRGRAGELGTPAVLKTAGFGYDGKGQAKIDDARTTPTRRWHAIGASGGDARGVHRLRSARCRSIARARARRRRCAHYGVIREHAPQPHPRCVDRAGRRAARDRRARPSRSPARILRGARRTSACCASSSS